MSNNNNTVTTTQEKTPAEIFAKVVKNKEVFRQIRAHARVNAQCALLMAYAYDQGLFTARDKKRAQEYFANYKNLNEEPSILVDNLPQKIKRKLENTNIDALKGLFTETKTPIETPHAAFSLLQTIRTLLHQVFNGLKNFGSYAKDMSLLGIAIYAIQIGVDVKDIFSNLKKKPKGQSASENISNSLNKKGRKYRLLAAVIGLSILTASFFVNPVVVGGLLVGTYFFAIGTTYLISRSRLNELEQEKKALETLENNALTKEQKAMVNEKLTAVNDDIEEAKAQRSLSLAMITGITLGIGLMALAPIPIVGQAFLILGGVIAATTFITGITLSFMNARNATQSNQPKSADAEANTKSFREQKKGQSPAKLRRSLGLTPGEGLELASDLTTKKEISQKEHARVLEALAPQNTLVDDKNNQNSRVFSR